MYVDARKELSWPRPPAGLQILKREMVVRRSVDGSIVGVDYVPHFPSESHRTPAGKVSVVRIPARLNGRGCAVVMRLFEPFNWDEKSRCEWAIE